MSNAKRVLRSREFFGRYEILDCLAESVMSQVYRVRQHFGGDSRILVLKTLHPRLLDDQKIRNLFFREIRTCMSLEHANIVQIHDFGEESGAPFIVMSWVDGRNLKQIIAAHYKRHQLGIAPAMAAHLAEQATRGLHYAHSIKDKISGLPLNLVHRDFSPHNVLVSFEGNVRIIDFGVAKRLSHDSDTQSDQVWGKEGYMSPEQIRAETLDRRSDLFSLGAVLWELLTGTKLFSGETEWVTSQKILNADAHVPALLAKFHNIPGPLAQIILKCLRADREQRYATAEEAGRDLAAYLRDQPDPPTTSTISRFVTELFDDDIDEERARLRELSLVMPTPEPERSGSFVAPELENDIRPPEKKVKQQSSGAFRLPAEPPVRLHAPAPISSRDADKTQEQRKAPLPSRKFPVFAVMGLVLIGIAGVAVYLKFQGLATSAAVALRCLPAINAETEVFLDGTKAVVNLGSIREVLLKKTHRLEIRRPGYLSLVRDFRFDSCLSWKGESCSLDLALTPVQYGELNLQTSAEAKVHLTDNREEWTFKTPLDHLKLPPGAYRLQVAFDQGPAKDSSVVIRKGEVTHLMLSPEQ